MPPAPPVLKPLAARSFCFGVGWRSGAIVGLLRHPCTCPDLETFFHKNAFQHIFPRKCVPNRFWDTVSNSPSTGTMCPTAPKRASGNERAIKPGVQGACPRPSFSPFLGRNGDPRRVGGAPGALRPKVASEAPPPEGTQHRAAPGRWSGFGLAQVGTCEVGSRPVPGGGSRLSLEKARTQRVAGGCPPPPRF